MAEITAGLLVFEWEKMPYVRAVQGVAVTHSFPRHMHDSYSIGIIDTGSRRIVRKNSEHVFSEKQMFVINPHESHHCEICDGNEHSYRVICITPRYVAAHASSISDGGCVCPRFSEVVIRDSLVADLFEDFFACFSKTTGLAECEYHLPMLVSELLVRYSLQPSVEPRSERQYEAVERVCDYVHEHFSEHITMAQLSSEACLSQFHMQRSFLRIKGVSPYEYLMKCRIDRAGELLLAGGSLSAIAAEVGFSDQSHFTRFFKRLFGVTPGRFMALNTRAF